MNLYKKLQEYAKTEYYPMHMPGHKRNKEWFMDNPYALDITEIDGFDNLHDAEEILKEAMEETAELFQTKQSFFLVNGSTCGILAGISAMTNRGDKVAIARNSHQAVYHAIYQRQLKPVYLYPSMLQYGIAGQITVDSVTQTLEDNPDITLVVLTSPTYEGIVSDIKKIAEVTHRYGAVLLVDEAHGAHLLFQGGNEKSALEGGADVVIQSTHKTLPAFTQTALLHRNSDLVSEKAIKYFLKIYETSSPSYLLMASLVKCMDFLRLEREEKFKLYLEHLDYVYEKLAQLKNLTLWNPEHKDASKLVIASNHKDITGKMLYEELRTKYLIQPEMASKDYVLCMTSVCDTKEGFDRLIKAILSIEEDIENGRFFENINQTFIEIEFFESELNQLQEPMRSYETYELDGCKEEVVPLMKSEGRVVLDYVYLYPPGIPLLVPGEIIDRPMIEKLLLFKQAELSVNGLLEEEGDFITVKAGEKHV
ncbi:aminotransferase class I/II-fold pyridoxal phosphate-dependent enzyme [Lachnoclostridium phytofermentans]|uniref:Orn/Lys/Arg decarboxylase major region n=1 Tax=Lachnoclostridium phytofermentans (strain ATCC 700394 / DSM 18823 / ISDg) TaxID=357809 RepID=A9KLV4_LACP7|nr:aminotransferase class V-fold PLP-dependent enzyme [Lachnoclostridium phytofermentans]ABX44263.1 Orn/Lys/Arg decarboxylase major region [Lachnoclostridium phytofermentans ISDg]